ncbi:MAG: hypothetical protein U9R42_04890 [Bacteroidota bacterium]|nr:hypothetical protein [Bacteroidota bacterium]
MKKNTLKIVVILFLNFLLLSTITEAKPKRVEVEGEITDQNGKVWHYSGWIEFKLLPPTLTDYDIWVTDPNGIRYHFTGIVMVNSSDCTGHFYDEHCMYLTNEQGDIVNINTIPWLEIYEALKTHID